MFQRKHLITVALAVLSSLSMAAYAQGGFNGPSSRGGFQGPAVTPTITTVEQAKQAPDDTIVLLRGYIVDHIRSDDYTFKDETGTIRVDIDHDKWAGQNVTPENLVEIWGEVDKGRHSIEIDVKSIRVIK